MKPAILCLLALSLGSIPALSQTDSSSLPDEPQAGNGVQTTAPVSYVRPTQGERFRNYIKATYGPVPLLEAALRGGIAQLRDRPEGWTQDGQGHADRFGSSMGQIAIRNTSEYVISDLFREDLRRAPRTPSQSLFTAALTDTFLARKGSDGHEGISIARLISPASGALVAYNVWYPSGTPRGEVGTQIGITYGVKLVGNLIRESLHR